jgi:hypothetical protein
MNLVNIAMDTYMQVFHIWNGIMEVRIEKM